MTDARVIRTRAALDKAIIELAAQAPMSDITVSELAATAGINRVTFYKHFNSPNEALSAALNSDLAPVREAWARAYDGTNGSTPEHLENALLSIVDHVERFRPVYETAIGAPHDGVVQNLLADSFTELVQLYLDARAKLDPPMPDIDLDIVARLFAHGLTGGIKSWVLSGSSDPSRFTRAALASAPAWLTAAP